LPTSIQAIFDDLDKYQRQYALKALVALCYLAGDRPIQALTTPQTLLQLSANQLNALKDEFGGKSSKRLCPFDFIGGGSPYITKEAARINACKVLLLGLDQSLPPTEMTDEAMEEFDLYSAKCSGMRLDFTACPVGQWQNYVDIR
jgi:hypothetical protein